MEIIDRLIRRKKHGLLLESLFYRLSKIGIEIFPFYLTQKNNLGQAFSEEMKKNLKTESEKLVTGFLEPSDMKAAAAIGKIYFSYLTEEVLIEMLSQGYLFLGIKHNDEIVAFTWVNLKECDEKILSFKLRKNEVYIAGTITSNAYRGENLAPYLITQLYKYLEKFGRNKYFSINALFNKPSLKFNRKLKYRPIKLYLYVSLFNKYKRRFLLKDYDKSISIFANNSLN